LHDNDWFGAEPVMLHEPGPPYAGLIAQLTPDPPGRASLIMTPVAAPWPLLLMVTVKPIGSPALTVAASAVFVIASDGATTVKTSSPHALVAPLLKPF